MVARDDSKALKHFIDRSAVTRLGNCLAATDSSFPLKQFVEHGSRGLEPLEFTARTRHVATALDTALPADRAAAMALIEAALPPPLAGGEGMFSENFWLWPLSDFVCVHGPANWSAAMSLCYALTQCFTAEFAVRPLLLSAPDKTLERMLTWTADRSQHVRRLCSEGTRPRLPWAGRLDLDLARVAPLLEALKRDDSRYVQKSVANHLNDIGKSAPQWLLTRMASWQQNGSEQTRWIVNHALRTQIKAGDPQALAIIGFTPPALASIAIQITPQQLKKGGTLRVTFSADNALATPQHLLLDWVMHYAGDKGARIKVFKGRTIELAGHETLQLEKKFLMEDRVTRRLHAGQHTLEVQVNGVRVASAGFKLTN